MRGRVRGTEEQSDDGVRTSLVPDRRENKGDEVPAPPAYGIKTYIKKLMLYIGRLI